MPTNRLAAFFLALAAGCGDAPPPATATEAVHAYCGDDYVAVERRIDRLLRRMTMSQKVELTSGALSPKPWLVPGLEELGIPPLVMTDGPRGASKTVGNATAFPVAIARGATFDPELERRIGETIGREVRAYGRNVLLAPTVNVLSHPRWGRAQETYGEDPLHLGIMGTGFVLGAQTQVPVVLKHFAVNNIENTRRTVDVTIDPRTLHEVYLSQFRRIIDEARVASVMSSYNSVNGTMMFENEPMLRGILKDSWGFAGPVVSDWASTRKNTDTVSHTERAAAAGLDIEMFVPVIYGDDLALAVVEGRVPEAQLDDLVRRGLRLRFCHHLDTNPAVEDPTQIETAEALALAREASERSMVLLRNEGGILPIARTAGTNIVVTGPLANVENLGDTGSSDAASTDVVTPLEGLIANAGAATVEWVQTTTAPADTAKIIAADVVVVVTGLTHFDEGEADLGTGDRDSLALPAPALQAISDAMALSTHVVVVLEGGSAVTMSGFVTDVEAIVEAWYPGAQGGNALARVLFGDVNPSGRLPIAFPVAEADLPFFDNVSTSVTYGYLHGYRYLDQNGTAPLFPFGFGLSYTTYGYANLAVTAVDVEGEARVHVEVDVTNTGSVAGRETVQLYVGRPTSAVSPRAPRDLRGFTQVDLAPGATQRVTIELPVSDLGYWDTATSAFVVEPTTYRFEVGSSSRNLPLTSDLALAP